MENKKGINILMVDDHQIITDSYKLILEQAIDQAHLTCEVAHTCDVAWEKMCDNKYDLVLLDLSFPIRSGSKFSSGEELGKKMKQEYPETKIIILTGNEETLQVENTLSSIDPEGFLLKGEANSREIARCVEIVLEGNTYRSPKISKLVRSRIAGAYNLDEYDRKILQRLALGTKTKDLPNYVPFSLRVAETRKKRLKELFDAGDNETLLRKAKEAGYL